MSAFDSVAPTFDRHRALPDGAPEAIRAAVLDAADASSPRLLDLGAGTGRIGIPFVAAGDDYVGVDLSFGMLCEFKRRAAECASASRLVQADGERLPFADASFDAIMLIQVFGGMRGWRRLLVEARRVLRGAGVLVLGRTLAPPDGLDARMKQQLSLLLDEIGAPADRTNTRQDAQGWLEQEARGTRLVAAAWTASAHAARIHRAPWQRRAVFGAAGACQGRGDAPARRLGRRRRSARSMQHRPSRMNSSCSCSGFHEGNSIG